MVNTQNCLFCIHWMSGEVYVSFLWPLVMTSLSSFKHVTLTEYTQYNRHNTQSKMTIAPK